MERNAQRGRSIVIRRVLGWFFVCYLIFFVIAECVRGDWFGAVGFFLTILVSVDQIFVKYGIQESATSRKLDILLKQNLELKKQIHSLSVRLGK